MEEKKLYEWVGKPEIDKILTAFSTPKTQAQTTKKYTGSKSVIRQFIKKKLIRCVNPESGKGRLYILTKKARDLLNTSAPRNTKKTDYQLIGWVLASPKQRLVVIKTLFQNSSKLTSEEIRFKSKRQNPRLSRISTKSILKELIEKGLVETEIGSDRRRYYWINKEGKLLACNLH